MRGAATTGVNRVYSLTTDIPLISEHPFGICSKVREPEVSGSKAPCLVVQKYGGSSLATPRHIQRAAQRIALLKESGTQIIIVASAMGHMTDHLIRLARRTVLSPPRRELDMLMTAGERISMSLLAMALHEQGVPAISFTGSQSGIITTCDHTDAKILEIRAHRIRAELAKGKVVIIAGFQGVSLEREITTLGRGGSDTSAIALAAVLNADYCEILTDVDGLFTADPRRVPYARCLECCPLDLALELARLGAKMHPRSLEVARRYGVSVHISSSWNGENHGTVLEPPLKTSKEAAVNIERTEVQGIASQQGYALFRIRASLPQVSQCLMESRSSGRFLTLSAGDWSLLCEGTKTENLEKELSRSGLAFERIDQIGIISIVGDGLGFDPTILARFIDSIYPVAQDCYLLANHSSSITVAIPQAKLTEAAQALHKVFLE